MPSPLAATIESQRVLTNKAQYVDAERKFHAKVSSNANKVQNDADKSCANDKNRYKICTCDHILDATNAPMLTCGMQRLCNGQIQ